MSPYIKGKKPATDTPIYSNQAQPTTRSDFFDGFYSNYNAESPENTHTQRFINRKFKVTDDLEV